MSKLAERMKKYDIPPIPCLPTGKKMLLYRIPAEEKTRGGLYVPDEHRGTENRAVVIVAGLGALDVMREHLIEQGDIVWVGRFAGTDKGIESQRDAGSSGKTWLTISVDDIHASEDAWERFNKDFTVEFDEKTGEHYYMAKGSSK